MELNYSGEQLLAFSVILGLLVGSFLNVVIYRVPVMLKRQWKEECHDFLELDKEKLEQESFNLVTPASTCPKCQHKIRPWENIPVISYLFLRGKCSNCKAHISLRYPSIEALTGLLSGVMIYHFQPTLAGAMAMVFIWLLIALFFIDLDEQLLPDNITLPLLWLGLIANSMNLYTDLTSALFGAVFGYLILWSIFWLFKLTTGKEGMGYGDFKLLAALGAWCGWMMLPQILIISSVIGLVFGLSQMFKSGESRPFPFGPSLAIAGVIAFLYGAEVNHWYLSTL
ncbi:A24 family peptidase [Litoribacillus peritrichatus]|uniref:Prepilin leader peptidase/N-methyltransferase n=1 Tax=Litoribacillus peritrichatus TaxID=718191 RepID=A0ABP7LYN5_9GAMM